MQTADFANSLSPWVTEPTQHSMTKPTDDLDLIRRMKAGDDDAVRDLYERYGQRLYAYALRMMNDPASAEDVTQNTLITAWRSIYTFRSEGRLIAWLLGIVYYTAMKSIRSTLHCLDQSTEEAVPDQQPSPEERVQGQEMKRWVREGLQALSSEHRAVLELVFYQGLSLTEVAEVMDCPLGTAKSRLSYARQHLHGVLSRTEENWR
jgi:RNA polymerase sigma-70 factor (ECF subfamily)